MRFALGGATTVVAGLIAAGFGPVVGGLFLAFPAIFPASATLVERHVRERKEKAGLAGSRRGRKPPRSTPSARRWAVSGSRPSPRSSGSRSTGSPAGLSSRRRRRGSPSRRRPGDCGERCETPASRAGSVGGPAERSHEQHPRTRERRWSGPPRRAAPSFARNKLFATDGARPPRGFRAATAGPRGRVFPTLLIRH